MRWRMRQRRAIIAVLLASPCLAPILLGLWAFSLGPAQAQTGPVSLLDEIYQRFAPVIARSVDYAANKPAFLNDPDRFEAGPVRDLLSNTSPAHTLTAILGEESVALMSDAERARIVSAIRESFRRYAYEWLEDTQMGALSLVGVEPVDGARARLQIRRSANLSPDFTFRVDIARTEEGWQAYNFGIFGVSYAGLKRAVYRATLDRGGPSGLADYLEAKNRVFFERFCASKRGPLVVACGPYRP